MRCYNCGSSSSLDHPSGWRQTSLFWEAEERKVWVCPDCVPEIQQLLGLWFRERVDELWAAHTRRMDDALERFNRMMKELL